MFFRDRIVRRWMRRVDGSVRHWKLGGVRIEEVEVWRSQGEGEL